MIEVPYEYYINDWHGTAFTDEESYRPYMYYAMKLVDKMTFNRTRGITEAEAGPELLNAVCGAAEQAYIFDSQYANITPGVKSESKDGHSVTFTEVSYSSMTLKKIKFCYNAIYSELADTGLLFRGV